MTKLEQARSIVALCDGIRDTLLGNLDRLPDAWGDEEISELVRTVAIEHTRRLSGARKLDFETVFLGRVLDEPRDVPAAVMTKSGRLRISDISFDTE